MKLGNKQIQSLVNHVKTFEIFPKVQATEWLQQASDRSGVLETFPRAVERESNGVRLETGS